MTMVSAVKAGGLAGVKPGDKVQFMGVNEAGKMFITAIASAL